MENMTTQENNILIAEFMGMKPHDKNELDGFWTNVIRAHKFDNVANLQFDTDWNWLMQVVEKIENITNKDNFILYDFNIYSDAVIVSNQNDEDIILINKNDGEFTTKIEAVYIACVMFTQWYNQQKN